MIRYAADSKTGVEVTGVVSVPVLLKTDSAFTGIALTAFEGNHNYGFEQKNLISGRLPAADSSREIALSGLTANQLGLRTGDRVDAIIFEGERMKPRRFKVSGIFSSAFSEFDRTIGYTSAACASRLVACNGLVGYISEVNRSYSKVTTILSPDLLAGAKDVKSKDTGVITGDADYSDKNLVTMKKLAENNKIKVGDQISTTGIGGMYPENISVGKEER